MNKDKNYEVFLTILNGRMVANQAYSKRLLCFLYEAVSYGYEISIVNDGFVLEDTERCEDFYLPYFYSEEGQETLETLEDEIGCGLDWLREGQEGDQEEMYHSAFDQNSNFDDSHLYLDVNKLWEAAVKEAEQAATPDPLRNENTPPSINWIGNLSHFIKPNKMGEISQRLHEKLDSIDVSVSECSVDYYRNNYEDIVYYHAIDASTFIKEVERLLKEVVEN